MSMGINAGVIGGVMRGPLFSDTHSRSCNRTRFCSTLALLLLLPQLSNESGFTEATVRSKTVKEKKEPRWCMISCAFGWAQNV